MKAAARAVAEGSRTVDRQPGAALVGPVFDRPAELRRYRAALDRTGLQERLTGARRRFRQDVSGVTVRGNNYDFGAIDWDQCALLYALVRKLRPSRLVETGVCNGASTAVILLALKHNRAGRLHSIDFPEHTETEYAPDAFWAGKRGAAVPHDRSPGWLVPDHVRDRWELTLGRSQDVLEDLLDRLGTIDFFLHDSEHSYECMSFEYAQAHAHLEPGGILASDDTAWNTAFADFAGARDLPIHSLGGTSRS